MFTVLALKCSYEKYAVIVLCSKNNSQNFQSNLLILIPKIPPMSKEFGELYFQLKLDVYSVKVLEQNFLKFFFAEV